jgi:hypothetical protein
MNFVIPSGFPDLQLLRVDFVILSKYRLCLSGIPNDFYEPVN